MKPTIKSDIYPIRYLASEARGSWVLFVPTPGGRYRFCRADAPYTPVARLASTGRGSGELAVLCTKRGGYAEIIGQRAGGSVVWQAQHADRREITATGDTITATMAGKAAKAPDLKTGMALAEQWLRAHGAL